jgi:hypothetical protein
MADNKKQTTNDDLHGYVKFPAPQEPQKTTQKAKSVKPITKPQKPVNTPQINPTRKPVNMPKRNPTNKPSKPSFPSKDLGFGGFDGGLGFGSPNRDNGDKTQQIKDIYKKILGKEPEARDLSYYRFSPMSEDEIKEKILNGEEHKKILEKGNKYDQIKEELEDTKVNIKKLQKQLEDNLEEFQEVNNLLKEKNRYIRQLREMIDNQSETPPNESTYEYTSRINMQPQIPDIKNNVADNSKSRDTDVPPVPYFTDSSEEEYKKKNSNILDKIFRS